MREGPIERSPAHAALISDVEWAMQRHTISPTRFGIEAIGDPNLVDDLHFGRMPRIDRVERILGYIDRLDPARVIARFGSIEEGIERLVDVLIEAKDRLDGEPEAEPGDTEDDFVEHRVDGSGCPLADPGGAEEAEHRDSSWPEWHSRGRHKLAFGGHEPIDRRGEEDDEDDDPEDAEEDR